MPATTGMKGSGYYDQHSAAQRASIHSLEEWLDDAIMDLPLPDDEQPITVLDMGSSEGRNAIQMMARIVAGLRRRTRQPIQTIYSDLASNNFNQLFGSLEEARRSGLFAPSVHASAMAGSFYGPLLRPGTVHLATCFNSIQWLDNLPAVTVPNFVAYRRPHPLRPWLNVSPQVTAAFKGQAEHDLGRFFQCRAVELVSGGKLLVAGPGDTDQIRVGDGFSDVFNDACLDLVAAGQLKREEYERFTFPVYFRTVEELLEPLNREDSPMRGEFTVDRAEAFEIPTPFLVEFQSNSDVEAYSRAYTGFMRAISEPVFQAAFGPPNGQSTVDALYERIRTRVISDPQRYTFRYIMVAALLTRR
jgi:hypothetical protein